MRKITVFLALHLSLGGCASLTRSEVTADEVAHLSKQNLTYEAVIAKFGAPSVAWETKDRKYAAYRINEYESAMSNVDGKGFVPGIGGFVDTFKVSSRSVTLEFEKPSGRYLGFTPTKPSQPAAELER